MTHPEPVRSAEHEFMECPFCKQWGRPDEIAEHMTVCEKWEEVRSS